MTTIFIDRLNSFSVCSCLPVCVCVSDCNSAYPCSCCHILEFGFVSLCMLTSEHTFLGNGDEESFSPKESCVNISQQHKCYLLSTKTHRPVSFDALLRKTFLSQVEPVFIVTATATANSQQSQPTATVQPQSSAPWFDCVHVKIMAAALTMKTFNDSLIVAQD